MDFAEHAVTAWTFSPLATETIVPEGMAGSHMGGDKAIMDAFVDAVQTGDKSSVLTPVEMSLDSHLMAFAAERARISGTVVDISEFETEFRGKSRKKNL